MIGDPHRSSQATLRGIWLAGIAIAAVWFLLGSSSTLAHTTLLSTDPADGAVLATEPERVTFTFNEPIDPVEDAFIVLAADGSSQATEVSVSGTQVFATLPAGLGEGTHVLGWRVISADGHPISGALTFSIGVASDPASTPVAASASNPWVDRLLGVSQGLGYLGLLIAVGLIVFRLLVWSTGGVPQSITWTIAALAAGVSIAGTALALPLTVARQYGFGVRDLSDLDRWTSELDTHEVRSLIALTLGLIVAVIVSRGAPAFDIQVATVFGVTLAVISPTLSGHTNSFDPRWVFRLSNVLHTLAGSIWLGGLIGLVLLLKRSHETSDANSNAAARVVSRFSTVAGGVLAALLLTGVINAWITLGSLDALWNTTYGQLILLKAGIVSAVIVIAAWNHFRLVPSIEVDAETPGAWTRLRRTVVAEAALLCCVALVTGFLVNQSPLDSTTSASNGPPPVANFDIVVGDGRMTGTFDPASLGQSELTFTLTNADGTPLEPVDAPEIKLYLRATDIGPLTTTAVAGESPGTFTATIQFPSTGLWDIEIPIRISRFEETTAKVTIEIR